MARPRSITGRTRVVGIIGDPVEHSRSPAMHNAAFAALGLDWVYVPLPVDARHVRDAVLAVRALGLAGVNVTVPHKHAVLAHLDDLSARAREAGAVNTIVNRAGRLFGDNTDVDGVLAAMRHSKARVRGGHVLVVGAGGSARAVLVALAAARAGRITIANRTVARGRALARRFRSGAPIAAVGLEVLRDSAQLADAALIVNTTSIGLHDAPFPPLAYAATSRDCRFIDLVYGRETDFLRRARRCGRHAIDGSEMLLQQGARAFTLWTRRRAPLHVMRAVLTRKS
jgi:shikimate dehydrogenase